MELIEVKNNRNGFKRKKASCDFELMGKSASEIASSIARIKRNMELIGARLPDGGQKMRSNLRRHEHELQRRTTLYLDKDDSSGDETIQASNHSDDGALHGKGKSLSNFNKLFRKKMEEEGEKVSSQSNVICVQGYKVKQSVAPVLESIFKKHGDIAAKCVFKPASMRSSFLEIVCEVVSQIHTSNDLDNMEEIEQQVLATEAANVNVSWLRVHLDDVRKRKEANKKCIMLMETKANTILVRKAAQMDLNERCAALMASQKRFEEAERCVRVLHLVEKNLNNNILESKGNIRLIGKTTSIVG